MSQSGGLGIAIIEAASRLGVGLSSFVSVGNKADLSGNDFLQYWEQDPEHQAGAALSRVVRQSPEVRPRRPPGGGHQAGSGGQERTVCRGRPRDVVAYRRDALSLRRDRRCAVRAGRGDPDRHHARAVRRRRAAVGAARPARGSGRDRHQRWRPRDPVRRRMSGGGGGDRGASVRRPSPTRRVPARGRGARQPDRHDRDRLGRRLPPDAPDARRRGRVRRDHHDLRPRARNHGRRCRRRDSRVRAGQSRGDDRVRVHGQRRRSARAVVGRRCGCPATSFPRTPLARWRWPPGTAAGAHETWARCQVSTTSARSRRRRSSARSSPATRPGCRRRAWRSCSTATACR